MRAIPPARLGLACSVPRACGVVQVWLVHLPFSSPQLQWRLFTSVRDTTYSRSHLQLADVHHRLQHLTFAYKPLPSDCTPYIVILHFFAAPDPRSRQWYPSFPSLSKPRMHSF